MADFPKITSGLVVEYQLVKFTKRLVFDIHYQHPDLIFSGEDDGDYFKYIATNGYEIISRSRMDIQTERLWILGAKHSTLEGSRSGTMVFSDNNKRDLAFHKFNKAMEEFGFYVSNKET